MKICQFEILRNGANNKDVLFGRLPLRVVEVGWDGDDGVLDRLAQVGLSGLLHLAQDEATDLRR